MKSPAGTRVSILANRDFTKLWTAQGVTIFGTSTTGILLPILAIKDFDAGPLAVGLLGAAQWLPYVLIGLLAGAWVDESRPHLVMIRADLIAASALVSIPVAYLTDLLTLAQLYAAALVVGTCAVFTSTAYPKLLTRIVEPTDLEAANSRVFGTDSVAGVVGPGIGGWMARFVGAPIGLLVDVVSYLVSATALARLSEEAKRRTADESSRPAQGLARRVGEGVRFLLRDRYLRWFTLQSGLMNFASTGTQTLLILLLLREASLTEAGVGTFFMLAGIGGVAGAMTATRISGRIGGARAMVVLGVVAGVGPLLLGFANHGVGVVVAFIGQLASVFAVVAGNVVRASWRQRYVPAELLGRATSASQLFNYGMIPLAALTAGVVGEVLGVRATIITMSVFGTLGALVLLVSPFAGRRDLPTYDVARPALAGNGR